MDAAFFKVVGAVAGIGANRTSSAKRIEYLNEAVSELCLKVGYEQMK